MKVLFAAAEAVPFIKTGGLADVIGALPRALQSSGAQIRVVLPNYRGIPDHFRRQMEHVGELYVPVGWRNQYCGIEKLVHEQVIYYFVDNEYYFGRDSVYGYTDDGERFAFLNRAVPQLLKTVDFQPDVIHCHDWHTGLIPVLLHAHYRHDPFYRDIRTVLTIHNLLYQGIFPYEVLGELLELDDRYFTMDGLEFYGEINYMKGGIIYSDHVTTVSPTYAREIQTDHFGYGLNGVLRSLGPKLSGIVNGIDMNSYNPATDQHIAIQYRSSIAKKRKNKMHLQEELHLPVSCDVPMIAMVTRMVDSKGLDLVLRVLDEMLTFDDMQFVILGTGDGKYEHWFMEAEQRHPQKMSARITFSEALSRKIYASSDIFLMPSNFEPCGISQLLALRYGSIPVVRETGGLNDTVHAYNEFTGEGNGFSFTNMNAHDMMHTIRRAISFYRQPEHWNKIVKNAIDGDYSWNISASKYMDIYHRIADEV
ncbi:glycogen synthase GlgA [Paenibacillus sp.]|jgi:starch synthase|uniref:glycogen synthase GlgA n=1 Tax=Paenibacillus sp. TaxID=58172 RepID=UPI00282D37BE|nr:glycogen synthase GlgA [Paenibacillus sp.]MDR0267596.1 glycogen synthase GlgA [Paenibacillus sp.]